MMNIATNAYQVNDSLLAGSATMKKLSFFDFIKKGRFLPLTKNLVIQSAKIYANQSINPNHRWWMG